MNIFAEMGYAVAGVKKYPEFLKNSVGKVFLYVVVLVFICTVIAQFKAIPNTKDFVEETKVLLEENADFELKNGIFHIEEGIYLDEDGVLVMIDSELGTYINAYYFSEWEEALRSYESVIIIDETSVLLKSDGEVQTMDFPAEFELTGEDVCNMLDYVYVFVGIYLVFVYLFAVAGYFLSALFVALVGMIICSFMNQKLTFGQLYLLALYAKTLPLLIKAVLKLLTINFFGYSIIAFAVACVYVGFAIQYMDKLEKERNRMDGPIIFP
ncbi:MAG: DUF1189 domain-containing protein [Lachnospiraceae bacterium]|nr:DUF1189 domain-containing protein [Lachnospiraceae bacterium]